MSLGWKARSVDGGRWTTDDGRATTGGALAAGTCQDVAVRQTSRRQADNATQSRLLFRLSISSQPLSDIQTFTHSFIHSVFLEHICCKTRKSFAFPANAALQQVTTKLNQPSFLPRSRARRPSPSGLSRQPLPPISYHLSRPTNLVHCRLPEPGYFFLSFLFSCIAFLFCSFLFPTP